MLEIVNADLSNPHHASALIRLLNEYALDEMGGQCELTDFVKTHLVAELHQRPGTHALLAFAGDDPAGLAICFEGFSTFACQPLLNIHDLVVAKQYRGLGLSKRLLAQAETIAQMLGCCKLTLEVLEGNHIAQSAYRSFGFSAYQLSPSAGKALFWQKPL